MLAQALVTRQVTIEHEYASALLHIPVSRDWYLLSNFPEKDWSKEEFMAERRELVGSECVLSGPSIIADQLFS